MRLLEPRVTYTLDDINKGATQESGTSPSAPLSVGQETSAYFFQDDGPVLEHAFHVELVDFEPL